MTQAPYQPPHEAGYDPGPPGMPTNDEKNMAMLAHLSGLLGLVVGGVLGFLGPLLLWTLRKDDSAYIEQEAKEALNFQLTLLIIYVVTLVVAMVTCLGIVLVMVPAIMQVVFGVIATVTASKGIPYRYPFNIRLIT